MSVVVEVKVGVGGADLSTTSVLRWRWLAGSAAEAGINPRNYKRLQYSKILQNLYLF